MDALRLEFVHPDGRSVYATTLHTPSYQPPAAAPALASTGSVKLSESGPSVVVETAGTRLELSKKTGQIVSWRAGGQDVVIGGPILNLGEGMLGNSSGGGGRGRGEAPSAARSRQN